MKIARFVINGLAILAITYALIRVFGSVQFAPWATDALVRCASFFGIYGIESIEDAYAMTTITLSLLLACILVWVANRAITRRAS